MMQTDLEELEKYATPAGRRGPPRKYATAAEAKAARNARRNARRRHQKEIETPTERAVRLEKRRRLQQAWQNKKRPEKAAKRIDSERSACAAIADECGRPDIGDKIRARKHL